MSVVARLEATVSTKWRAELVGDGGVERRHWRTKTAHYHAVEALLAAEPTRVLRWETVVGAVQPKGSRSTFYEVTGSKAAHALVTCYLTSRTLECADIGFQYRRELAVDQLIDETKVWSYWSLRQSWLQRWRDEPQADDEALVSSLESTVAGWARGRPELAAALGYAPPMCAVEDFIVVCPGKIAPLRANRRLADVVRAAVGDDAVADDARDDRFRTAEPIPVQPKPERTFELRRDSAAVPA